MNKILKKIEEKTGIKDITKLINENFSGSNLNSFLLGLFKQRSSKVTPASVLKEFNKNRFCFPSPLDPVLFKEEEIRWLRSANTYGFKPIQLSPLTPFGTSSSVALVNQNNVVTALRGTEIISDATNVLALKVANDIRELNEYNKYCTTHRHVRGQYFTNPLLSSHFGLFCMVTPGKDEGSFRFEIEQLENHLEFYYSMLSGQFSPDAILLKVFIKNDNKIFTFKLEECLGKIKSRIGLQIVKEKIRNDYYDELQFKYFIKYKDEYLDVADGGFVNWTQKLLNNRKQRLLISGAGLEIIVKIEKGLI